MVSLASGEIKGWDKKDWGRRVKVDKTLDQAKASDYDAIVLPRGHINPDLLRVEPTALNFIKEIFDAKKIVAAVCHAPWLLIETGIAKGRKMTSYKSIKTDVMNAGGKWEDSEVVVDEGVITSRNPGDLEAFSAKIIEEVKEGRHTQRSAAQDAEVRSFVERDGQHDHPFLLFESRNGRPARRLFLIQANLPERNFGQSLCPDRYSVSARSPALEPIPRAGRARARDHVDP